MGRRRRRVPDRLRGRRRPRSRSAQGVLRSPCARARSSQRHLVRARDGEPRASPSAPRLRPCARRRLARSLDSRRRERGEAVLRVMAGSWAHSLHPPDTWAQYEVGTQPVPVEAMADILEEIESLRRAAPDREGEHRGRGVRDRARNPARGVDCESASSSSRCTSGLRARGRARCAPRTGRLQGDSDRDGRGAEAASRRSSSIRSTYRSHVSARSTVGSGARAERAGVELVAQHAARARARSAALVTRRDEAAVLAVDEPVASGYRLRARDDHRLSERHRLQEHRRSARVAVLAHGQRDDTRLAEPPPHRLERDVGLDDDVLGRPGQMACMVGARDDPKAHGGHARRDAQEEREVAMRVDADRDDVEGRRLPDWR